MSPDVPVPRDLPLALPASEGFLQVAVVLLFLLHIAFVALMVGGSVLAVAYEWRGLRDPDLDTLARRIAKTVTVNKSLAVVLGVGPLLVVNVLYTAHFYAANALTGTAWLSIVPLVAAAFLLTYAHGYGWDALAERKGLHLAIGAAGAALLLAIPLVFLANVNLMLFPDRWPTVRGIVPAVVLPNVLPRYLHFLCASFALTGLFLAFALGRRGFDPSRHFVRLDRAALRREFLGIALGATGLQAIAGPLLLFTLPSRGLDWPMLVNVGAGAVLALAAAALLWGAVRHPAGGSAARFWTIVVLLAGTVTFMAYGRHRYRENALAPHRALMAERSGEFESALLAARMREAAGVPRVETEADTAGSAGERRFRAVCMGCHSFGKRLVGPPVEEIAGVYLDDPDGLVAWIRSPGRKRPDYPEMPPIRMTEAQYREVADFLLGL